MDTPAELVARRRSWGGDDWWLLEIAAFRDHRAVRMALAGRMPMMLWDAAFPDARRNPFVTAVQVILLLLTCAIVLVLMPLVALRTVVLVFRGLEQPLEGWQIGVTAFAAAATVAYFTILWRSRPNSSGDAWLPAFLFVPGLTQLAMSAVAWHAGAFDGGAWWVAGPVAAVLVGGVELARIWRIGAARRPPAGNVEAAVAQLDERARQQVRSELVSAFNTLQRRGLISAEVADVARAAELGTLGLTLGTERPRPRPGDEQRPSGAL